MNCGEPINFNRRTQAKKPLILRSELIALLCDYMSFEKQEPVKADDLHIGCLNCSTACLEAPMDMVIAVGFGVAFATKDGIPVYEEDMVENDEYLTVGDIEEMAKLEPDHDWKIHKHGPMHGETFQRQGEGKWVCIESNRGFI